MKDVLNRLIAHHTLSKAEAKQVLKDIALGELDPHQISVFLAVYMMRPIRVEELEGFRDALLELCIPINLDAYNPIDLCGTGGDGKNTFNISTLASFIVAGAGVKVAKHGNYGVSSASGSSNVLEYLGVNFTNKEDALNKQIEEAGICFLHAPLFHPALKNVGPIRKALGLKTFFNMLGHMVNPAFPKKQIVGVFNLELARMYGYLYQQTDKQFSILHALDGYDEVSLTSDTKVITQNAEQILKPSDFGVPMQSQESIFGGDDVPSAAAIFKSVISGKGTEQQNNVVCANAALAIQCYYDSVNLPDAFAIAKESLLGGKAKASLDKLISLQ